MKQTKNLFNKLKFYLTWVQAKKKLQCKKNDFCDCTQDMRDMCVPCIDQNRGRFMFCPGSDPVPPCDLKVESTFPTDLTSGVAIDVNPVVVFSEDIDPLLANEMSVRDGVDEVSWTREIIDNNTFVFTPATDLDNSTEYEVRYSAWVWRDCFVEWAFTFITTDPTVFNMSSQSPEFDATWFPTNGSVQITFNMDLLPAWANNITILDDMSANVMWTTAIINWMPNVMVFTPTWPYICGKTYTGTFTAASIDWVQTTSGTIRFTTENC